MNLAIIKGNLTRDPELRYTPNGKAIASFGVAVNEVWKTEAGEKMEKCHFFDVDAWGRTAENVAQYFKKGKPILVEGKLQMDAWDDKQTGQKRTKVKIVMSRFHFCGDNKGGSTQASAGEGSQPDANYEAPQADAKDTGDDVPF